MKIGALQRESKLEGEKSHGKEYSRTKRSLKIPDILLRLATESRVGAKKRKWKKRKLSPSFIYFNCYLLYHLLAGRKKKVMLSPRVTHIPISFKQNPGEIGTV